MLFCCAQANIKEKFLFSNTITSNWRGLHLFILPLHILFTKFFLEKYIFTALTRKAFSKEELSVVKNGNRTYSIAKEELHREFSLFLQQRRGVLDPYLPLRHRQYLRDPSNLIPLYTPTP